MAESKVISGTKNPKKSTLIKEASDVYRAMRFLENEDRETLYALCLNAKNFVTHRELVTIGTLTSSLIHPREVFRSAIKNNSASVICVHNHPSGDPAPSRGDIDMTLRLIEAGQIIGVKLLDHIVIGNDCYFSMVEENIVGFRQSGKTESIEQKGKGYFDPVAVVEIYDEMTEHNLSLETVAGLLKKINLNGNDSKAEDLVYGLSQIIEMYIERQESILQRHVDRYRNSNIALTECAESTIQMVEQGAFTSKEVTAVNLREALHKLDIVIGRDGCFKEKAEKLKAECNRMYVSL